MSSILYTGLCDSIAVFQYHGSIFSVPHQASRADRCIQSNRLIRPRNCDIIIVSTMSVFAGSGREKVTVVYFEITYPANRWVFLVMLETMESPPGSCCIAAMNHQPASLLNNSVGRYCYNLADLSDTLLIDSKCRTKSCGLIRRCKQYHMPGI